MGDVGLFLSVIVALQKEDLIQRSPRGQRMGELLKKMVQIEERRVSGIASCFQVIINDCLLASKKHKLASAAQASLWSTFHRLRGSQDLDHHWDHFMAAIPDACLDVSRLCMQLILDRMLKRAITEKAAEDERESAAMHMNTPPISFIDMNAIRYMAGYVGIKLLKKYKKRSKNDRVQQKRRFFVRVLEGMRADQQPGEPDSPAEYSKLWSELIDRGGLYHISDDTCDLIVAIEVIVRKHINNGAVQLYIPGTDVRKLITDEVIASQNVITLWEKVAKNIPTKYELYSIELLGEVVKLWVTIRGYSFAKDWTMQFEKKYKKGTRKGLQAKKD